jgi:hypothetical protein
MVLAIRRGRPLKGEIVRHSKLGEGVDCNLRSMDRHILAPLQMMVTWCCDVLDLC